MPSAKSARVSERKRVHNAPLRSKVKTQIRKARRTIATGDMESAQQAVKDAIVALDKAAQKGSLHKNNASRRKSRIMSQLQKALAEQD